MSATATAGARGIHRLGTLVTAGGERLADARLAWRIIGDQEAAREHGWIVVFHALTGSADVTAWWGPLVGDGRPLDTGRHAVLCANLLGSCHGSTGPRSWRGGPPDAFPALAPADLAQAVELLLRHLGIDRVALAAGGSLGGMVALEWARRTACTVDRLVVIAAPAATSAQAIAWNAAQRLAIEADPRWRGGRYAAHEPPVGGLAAARAIAMMSYRSPAEFRQRFGRGSTRVPGRYDVEHWLRRHGEKLVARFDAASYWCLLGVMDRHDLGDLRTAARATAARVGTVTGVGIDRDVLYEAREVRHWVEAYRAAGARARYAEIASVYGHDAFLIEWDQVAAILRGD